MIEGDAADSACWANTVAPRTQIAPTFTQISSNMKQPTSSQNLPGGIGGAAAPLILIVSAGFPGGAGRFQLC